MTKINQHDGRFKKETVSSNSDNSGHGMLFLTFEGKRLFSVYNIEEKRPRKPQIIKADDSGDKPVHWSEAYF